MSSTELKELRKEVKKYIDNADERVLKIVYAMLDADKENTEEAFPLSAEQIAELDKRMQLDAKGKMKYATWSQVEKRIKSSAKHAI